MQGLLSRATSFCNKQTTQRVIEFETPVVKLYKFDYLPEAGWCPS